MPLYRITYKDRKGDQKDPEALLEAEIEAETEERALDLWSENYCGDEIIDAMESTKISINPLDGDGLHPLYHHYQQEIQAQPARVELDLRDGSLIADWDAEVGNGVSEAVWNGLIRRYDISPQLTRDEINALLVEVAPIAQRILDGTEITSDGLRERPALSAKARDAEAEMESGCQSFVTSSMGVYDARDWFECVPLQQNGSLATMTDEALAALAEECRLEALTDGATVLGIEEHLREVGNYD